MPDARSAPTSSRVEAFNIVSHLSSFSPPPTTLGKLEGAVHPHMPDPELSPQAA